ncbi:fumarylacetoacetate hydrolase family protein [Pseudoalteromonas luteoviolacea]|uniref:fumarylacetoacetate hydrolase family protein n=1 Tax=Pseudoalteromonas luteoviolacea TaxID=43657 RepID=UPI001B39D088|nr:fumarylacetoacetate hydrolase family protein [Pseudoalteromonas luteoviolacea]MBQ4879514.1 fumarylacetoacetate hydrolase family protein [Pseudoalteromonas luteoviolacea]MBQ4908559.1 fumarylacetoacetate hydrolase family protein [Pseudoalteromonas luteoviolacea]
MYQHKWVSGETILFPAGKAVCIGRNYVAHAQELNNPIPESPLLFIKPANAFCDFAPAFTINEQLGEHHYEAELVLLVGETITANTQEPLSHICGIGLGLDLTLRHLQSQLKAQGHPWERAKAFDGSACLSAFMPVEGLELTPPLEFKLWQNDQLKQHGETDKMIFKLGHLLQEISRYFTLQPGDIVMTGTPQGVGKLAKGDRLKLELGEAHQWQAIVE